MITTHDIKTQQLANGFFQTGTGPEKILVMGSCRVCAYVNYLDIWNRGVGLNRFTIYSIDPHNWHFHPVTNEIVDLKEAVKACETDPRILDLFKTTDYFLHEYYKNYGCFNIFKGDGDKNIYDYGMAPKVDIMIPSWNDIFVLFNNFYTFDAEFKKMADTDYAEEGKLSHHTKGYITYKAACNLDKFFDVCSKSSIPQMEDIVRDEIGKTRFFQNSNHISKEFSMTVFGEIYRDIGLNVTQDFWEEISKIDVFANDATPLTEYDVECFGYEWGEPVVNFQEYNKIGV